MSGWKRTVRVVGSVVLALLGLALTGAVALYAVDWWPRAFDAQAWAQVDGDVGPMFSHGPGRDNRRARMVGDLLARCIHTGMTKDQVEAALGHPGWGGGGGSGGQDWEEQQYYDLLAFPSLDQKAMAWLRWRTARPVLELRYRGSPPKLVSARVGGY